MNVIVCFHKKNNMNQCQVYSPEHDPIQENTQEAVTEIDLDNFNIENLDALAPWEQNAHIWIDQQICSITNANYDQ